MRQIKFRFWNELTKKMVQMHDLYLFNYCFTTIITSSSEWKVMQYTGRKDKTGKEIYEGDIIEFDRIEWGGNDNIHVVSWNNETAEWSWGGGTTSDMEWRTVIGNIYENPELLTNKI